MRGKALFVVGLGVGYVLGTRAGRERYEQIKKAAEGVWNTPAVQQGVGTVKDFAASRVGDLSDNVLDGVKSFIGNTVRGTGATKSEVGNASRSAKEGVAKSARAAKSAVDTAADALDDVIDQASETAAGAARPASQPATKRSTPPGSKPAASDS